MAARKASEITIRRLRSAIANGRLLGTEVDARSAHMRRLRDLVADFRSHLGGDVTGPERILLQRASMLTLLTEMLEAKFINRNLKIPNSEYEKYLKTITGLQRLLVILGLQRRAREVGPTLRDLLRGDDIEVPVEQQEAAE